MRQGSIPSELLMRDGGVWRILLLPLVARCLETIDTCICTCLFFMTVIVGVCGNVCYVAAVGEDSVFKPWSDDVCCMFV